MACRWIYVRMALSVIVGIGLDVGIIWFYFRRVLPFMRAVQHKFLAGKERP